MMDCVLQSINPLTEIPFAIHTDANSENCCCAKVEFDRKNDIAWFTHLVAGKQVNNARLSDLIEYLIIRAGEAHMRACAVVIDDGAWYAGAFRQLGFGIIAKQQIWRLKKVPADKETNSITRWRPIQVAPFDRYDLFYHAQIPPLNREIGNNWHDGQLYGLENEGEILASAKVTFDKKQYLYIEPIFHPSTDDPAHLIVALADQLIRTPNREVTVMIPGYQAWADDLFHDRFDPVCQQLVFFKRLTEKIMEREAQPIKETSKLQPAGSRHYSTEKAE